MKKIFEKWIDWRQTVFNTVDESMKLKSLNFSPIPQWFWRLNISAYVNSEKQYMVLVHYLKNTDSMLSCWNKFSNNLTIHQVINFFYQGQFVSLQLKRNPQTQYASSTLKKRRPLVRTKFMTTGTKYWKALSSYVRNIWERCWKQKR